MCFSDIQHILFILSSTLWSVELVIVQSQKQIIKRNTQKREIKEEGIQRVRMGLALFAWLDVVKEIKSPVGGRRLRATSVDGQDSNN